MVVTIRFADAPDTFQRFLVADVASKRITGIRRIDDQPALARNFCRTANQPQLRILGM
ncbi:hypothetical protein D3C83_276600 [compost metagenome]